mgnify:CR=1 FL=1
MKHLETLWQYSYDYHAVFECEFCGSTELHKHCYADNNFDHRVIPAIRCSKCNKKTDESLPDERLGCGVPVVKKLIEVEEWVRES